MSPAGGGAGGGKQGVEMMSGKLKADKTNNYAYNKILQPFANKLRKEMTKAEACLWKYALRASQMKGYQFRRQRPVLRYIADFLCIEEYERCYRENRKGGGRDGDVQSLHFSTP